MKRVIVFIASFTLYSSLAWALPEGDLLRGVMPGDDDMIDVAVIMPHPDDETVFMGGTIIKLKKDHRVRVHFLCLTLGDLSDAKDRLRISAERIGQIRFAELTSAATVLGADAVIQLQYHDGSLEANDVEKLMSEVRSFIENSGAEIVMTYEPAGVYGHIDHVAASRVTTEAFRGTTAQKLYYMTLPRSIYYLSRVVPIYPVDGLPDPVFAEFMVNIREEQDLKRLAIYEHASQRYFSSVGILMETMARLSYEYFALGAEN